MLSFSATHGLLEKAIHHALIARLQENAVSYSSVTRFYREPILGLNSEEASSSPKDKDDGLDELNEPILLALLDEPFSSVLSVRQIARRICPLKGIVCHQLVGSLHFTIRQQTSSLGSSQALRQSEGKSSRVELSIQLRNLLLSIRHNGWDGDAHLPLTSHGSTCRQIRSRDDLAARWR
jgi:hypothetical protein